MILTYKFLTNIFYPFFVLFTYLRKIKKKEDPIRFKEKIFTSSFKINRKKNSKLISFRTVIPEKDLVRFCTMIFVLEPELFLRNSGS